MTQGSFEHSLRRGKVAESKIAKWLRYRGWTVLPVYEIEQGHGKGPQIFTPDADIIAPDILAWRSNKWCFIEAKNKSVFTWYRQTATWQTGIDQKHWEHYLEASAHFGIDVWLMFLHESRTPSSIDIKYDCCPDSCPTGLFGNTVSRLATLIDHASPKHGRSGMVYWNHADLRLICDIDNLQFSSSSN